MSYEVNRRLAARRAPLEAAVDVDSVTAGIVRGAFETTCFETAMHLGRAASSAIINQSNERNGSIIDGHGRLAGLSVGIPQLLFISPMSVRYGLDFKESDDWGPGDVFVGNDPTPAAATCQTTTSTAPISITRARLLRSRRCKLTREIPAARTRAASLWMPWRSTPRG